MDVHFFLGQAVRLYAEDDFFHEGEVVKIALEAKRPYVEVDFSNWIESFSTKAFRVAYSDFYDISADDYPSYLLVIERGVMIDRFVKTQPGEL